METKTELSKVLVVDVDNCTGCRICELVCSMEKQGEYNPKKSLIRVIRNKEAHVNIPVLDMKCDFCGECVDWCPTKALSLVNLGEAIAMRKGAKIGSFPIPQVCSAEA